MHAGFFPKYTNQSASTSVISHAGSLLRSHVASHARTLHLIQKAGNIGRKKKDKIDFDLLAHRRQVAVGQYTLGAYHGMCRLRGISVLRQMATLLVPCTQKPERHWRLLGRARIFVGK